VRLPLLVGRGAEAKFRIQHEQVSRRHCEFFAGDDVVYVRDLGSTNGTFLAGEQIPTSARTPVPCGAMVRVGKLAFVVEYSQAKGRAAAANRSDDTQSGFDAAADRSAAAGDDSFAVDHPGELFAPDEAPGDVAGSPVEPVRGEADARRGDDPFAAVAAAFLSGGEAAADAASSDEQPRSGAAGDEPPQLPTDEARATTPAADGVQGNAATGEGTAGDDATGDDATGDPAAHPAAVAAEPDDSETADSGSEREGVIGDGAIGDGNASGAARGGTTKPEPEPEPEPQAEPEKTGGPVSGGGTDSQFLDFLKGLP